MSRFDWTYVYSRGMRALYIRRGWRSGEFLILPGGYYAWPMTRRIPTAVVRRPRSDLDLWSALVAAQAKRFVRGLWGAQAPKRKRPRRIQRKIDKRYGALHHRDADRHFLRQVIQSKAA
jgi:hypothetical protein